MKIKKRYLIPFLLLAAVALGPRPDFRPLQPKAVQLAIPLERLDNYVRQQEASEALLKPDNHARIIWADSIRKTEYSIVYLHGFSASPMEGDPLHIELGQRYGANLYLARLAGHGLNTPESFATLTPNQLLDSAEEALAIGRALGKKVILMSCSTGSTLAIYLAAQHPELVYAQLLYSPNIALENSSARILSWPWGKQLLYQIQGEYRHIYPMKNTPAEQYWTTSYRSEGLLALKSLLDQTMTTATFQKIDQPFLMAYYYKNEEEKDQVVSVSAMLDFFDKTKTPPEKKWNRPLASVGNHVIASRLLSRDVDAVRQVSYRFMEEVLGLKAKTSDLPGLN